MKKSLEEFRRGVQSEQGLEIRHVLMPDSCLITGQGRRNSRWVGHRLLSQNQLGLLLQVLPALLAPVPSAERIVSLWSQRLFANRGNSTA